MIRRPTATDTEDDLLAFQEKFMSSGEKPSASVDPHRKIKVGSKRDQHDDSSKEGPAQARDVVDIKKVEGKINELLSNGTGCGNATTSLHTLNAHTLARIL